jgi:hypothetical protein
MISIQQLINVAPFPEETKQELLTAVPTMADAKKFELEELCWALTSQWYQNEIQIRSESMIMEMAKGEKEYTKEEISAVPQQLFSELVKKLATEETKEDLEKVREKLAQVTEAKQG